MGRTTQNLYRLEIDTPVRFSVIKGEEEEKSITYINPLLRIEDALTLGHPLGTHMEGVA